MDELRSGLFYEQKNGYDLIDMDERVLPMIPPNQSVDQIVLK